MAAIASREPAAPAAIGVVGLGGIGLPLAVKLLEAGHEVWGHRRGSKDALEDAGGRAASSAREVAERADLVFTSLPSAEALHEVVDGPDGLAAAARDGLLVVETSTIPIADKERARDALRRGGADMLDAPTSGTPGMLNARQSVFFVSGERPGWDRVRPVLEVLTDASLYVGDFGVGLKLKVLANHLVAIHTAAAGEALALAELLGLDLHLAVDALSPSAGGSSMFAIRGRAMADGRFGPWGGTVVDFSKSFDAIEDAAEATGAATPLYDIAARLYRETIEAGRTEYDIAVVMDQLRRMAAPPEST